MRLRSLAVAVPLACLPLACATEAHDDAAAETGAETGDAAVPCSERAEADCFGLSDPDSGFEAACQWISLIPLPDAGNSCMMAAPTGACMAVSPILDGCGGTPELECTLGDTTAWGTGAVIEIDGVVYLLDGSFECYPPGAMTACTGPDTELGCECACDRILGG